MKPFLLCLLFLAQQIFAQGYDDPLTIQGVDHNTLHSAASRAAGGTTIGIQNDVGLMFTNPASLQSLKRIQLLFGGLQQYTDAKQVQQYAPLKYYSNFSLLMEGLTGYISDPDSNHPGSNAGDTVQRPYDDLGPNWSRSKNKGAPIQALLAVPFSIGESKFVVGVGAIEYADMDHYYQNNNVLAPSIGLERPVPIPLPPNNPDSTFKSRWYQYSRAREGSIRGYGMALSVSLSEKISLGASGMILTGSTDDFEQRIGRGRFVFYYNYFRLDSVYHRVTGKGTSDFSGQEFTLSGIYRGRYVSLGFSAKLPTKITRKFTKQIQVDTTGSLTTTTQDGEERIRLPWRGTVGISIMPTENLVLGFEYELRPYEDLVYPAMGATGTRPWVSSSVFHVGAQYTPLSWLAVRAGMRGQAEVFEPAGNPMVGEQVSYNIYSAGCGLSFGGVRLNITYEYALMKYEDIWATNVNLNSETRHSIIADVSYEIPWTW